MLALDSGEVVHLVHCIALNKSPPLLERERERERERENCSFLTIALSRKE